MAAVACLCLAGPLALPAQAQTTNFYLWRTTITVGESSGTLGYDNSDSLGSISTSADFGYPPWNPPHKHHVDRSSYYTVEAIKSYETQGNVTLEVAFSGGEKIAEKLYSGPRSVTLWLNQTAYPFSVGGADANSIVFRTEFSDTPNVTWKEDDEVKVALVYKRRLPSAPTNVRVTAPPGEDGTLEVSWEKPEKGTFPIECYLVEFRHPSGEAKKRKQSYPGSLGPGKGCGDSPPTSVRRTDLETDVQYQVLVQALSGDGFSEWSETKTVRANGRTPRSDLTASFVGMPAKHDGERAFRFRVAFSENIGISFRALRENTFTVSGGRVTGGRRVDDRRDLFEMTVEPDSGGDVTITLPAGRACGVSGAICTKGENRRPLTNTPTAKVAGPLDDTPESLTARFVGMPEAHTGEGGIRFRVAFSEDIGISFQALREDAFTVTGGLVTGGKRVDGRRDLFRMTVRPDSDGDVTIALPAGRECGVSGAICTKGEPRRHLTNSPSSTMAGPVGIAVALSRAASGTLTVDYATSDGTATAGEDYTATSGTLTFEAGESKKMIEVTVLDDAHNEGEETLTLRLSDPSGGRVTDGEATGTIENRDPLQKALLARFGRAAAVHVVEQVQERIEAQREVGIEAQFAGRQLRPGMEREMAVEFLSRLAPSLGANRVGAGVPHPMSVSPVAGTGSLGIPGLGGGAPMGTADELLGGANPMGSMRGTDGGLNQRGHFGRGLGGGNLLTGSAFVMNHETRRGGILSFWSRGAQSRFAGRDGQLSLDGRVRTTMFGADYAKGPLVTGLSLSHSRGLGGYSGVSAGEVTSSVTGLYPWLGYKVSDRITLWGVTGYGKGALTLTPAAGTALRSGLSMAMTAGGMRGELADSVVGGFGLAFKADGAVGGHGHRGRGRPARASGGDLGGGDPLPDGAGSLALLSLPAGVVAPAQPGGRSAARRRGRRERRGRGRRRRADRIGRVDRTVGRRAGADAAGPPGPGVPGPGHVGVVQLQPDAVDAAGVHGEADPVLGRTGHQRRPGSLGPGDDGGDGTGRHGFGEPSGGGAGLWAAGREPAGGDAEVRHRDLRVRAGLPAGLRPDRIAAWQYELRAGHRRHAPGELEAGRHGPRSPRPAHGALVNTARQQQ